MIIDLYELVVGQVRELLPIAQGTLREYGTHFPTAILHTPDGLVPIVLPFKNDDQKRAMVARVKVQATEASAYAVTMITCARVVDSRTDEEYESLVLTTSVYRGPPHFMTQPFFRDADRRVVAFAEPREGDDAAMPGQMMIVPEWEDELEH